MHQMRLSLGKLVLVLFVTLFSPFVLAKLGFWGPLFATSEVHFPDPLAERTLLDKYSFAAAVQRAAPAVVSIHTQKEIPMANHPMMQDPFFRYFFGDPDRFRGGPEANPRSRTQSALGSGVLVHEDGYVLTNYHVIQDASSIKIVLSDGRESDAKLMGSDPDSDLAVLQITLDDLPVIPLGDAQASLVGDLVLAIGNPLGIGQTVTQGIISAKDRSHLGINRFENFLQTDAAINTGNSGGALVDASGRLLGINTAILTHGAPANMGIGFAIPVNYALAILKQLINEGEIVRGWLGITLQTLDAALREELHYDAPGGVVVVGVTRQGPAHRAGLLPGDIIVALNEEPITDSGMLVSIASQMQPGTRYALTVIRDGMTIDTTVKAGKRPSLRSSDPE